MTDLLRYAGIAILLLFVLAVAIVCGELVCESCFHSCCVRADRSDKVRRLVARIQAALSQHVSPAENDGRSVPVVDEQAALAPYSTRFITASLRI